MKDNLFLCGDIAVTASMRRRISELEQELRARRSALRKKLPGTIRIKKGKNPEYYLRLDSKDKSGRYLKRSEERLIRRLLQQRYDEKWVREAERELAFLERALKGYESFDRRGLYSELPRQAQQLIDAAEMSDADMVKLWLVQPYQGLPFRESAPELFTSGGLRVRSKSEILIAELLDRLEIPYRYECPLQLRGGITVHPDFTVLDVRNRRVFYWEHLGMMDDREYVRESLRKLNDYAASGYFPGRRLMLTYESASSTLNIRLAERQLREMMGVQGGGAP